MNKSKPIIVAVIGVLALFFFASCVKDGPVNPWHPDLAGEIAISIEPDYLEAGWTLAGPDGLSKQGSGATVFADIPAGSYTVSWADISGWTKPGTSSGILEENGQLSFSGAFTMVSNGSVVISVEPAGLSAPWTLIGPYGFQQQGGGSDSLSDLPIGTFTLTWNTVAGYTTPSSDTQTLTADGTITFLGEYVEASQTGTILINTEPASISPSWDISGPSGYATSGFGDMTLSNLDPGEYAVTWQPFAGWDEPSPNSENHTLVGGQTLTVTGTYEEQAPILTFIGMFVSDNGSDLGTYGAWGADNHYTVHVLLGDVPAVGVSGWEAQFTYSGSNTVMQEGDFFGGTVTGDFANKIVEYSTPRLPNANGYLHVADLNFYCGTQSVSHVEIQPVSVIGHTPSVLLYRHGGNPDQYLELLEYGGEAVFTIQ